MTFLNAILFGFVEGITEFLPISSTAHLILTAHLLGLEQSEFQKTFEVVIQLGAILSVVVLYGKIFLRSKAVILRVLAAFIPTGIIGFLLQKVIKKILFVDIRIILWSLFIGGIILIIFELWHDEKKATVRELEDISYKQAVGIGLFQALAVIPGVSRSAATIIGGSLLGLKRRTIIDFSFLLAAPTMLAASVLDLAKSGYTFTGSQFGLLAVGFVVSFFVALASIKWLLGYIKHHTFVSFGIYRVVVAVVFWVGRW